MADITEEVETAILSKESDDNIALKDFLKEKLSSNITIREIENVTDTCYLEKGNEIVTAYDDGEVVQGKIEVWDGQKIECPQFKDFNWYISTCGQLKFLEEYVNNGKTLTTRQVGLLSEKGYKQEDVKMDSETKIFLMNNLDLGARKSNESWNTDYNNMRKWNPIGKATKNVLEGTFLGNGYSIRGLYVNEGNNFAGLFANCYSVEGLTIKNSYVSGGSCVGGIIAAIRKGNIKNCHNINTVVEGKGRSIGGIVGQIGSNMNVTIEECSNSGNITETTGLSNWAYTGGVVGHLGSGCTIKNCINNGNVEAIFRSTGGVVGYCQGTVYKCTNNGYVEGKEYNTGGIVGSMLENFTVSECINNGKIKGKGQAGGIIGATLGNVASLISQNKNKGQIEGDSYLGGIIGTEFSGSKIEKCANVGKILASGDSTGGIVGYVGESIVIENCYNTAAANGKKNVGGIIGTLGKSGTIIKNSYNAGSISGDSLIGGIVGNKSKYTYSINNSFAAKGTATTIESDEEKEATDMKKEDFIILLGRENWKLDYNINNGYPVLNWE